MTFFYPVFDFQSTLLQVKSNDSKIFNVKTILQSNSNMIVPMIPHGVVDTMGDTEDTYHTYIMIPFAQSEKVI